MSSGHGRRGGPTAAALTAVGAAAAGALVAASNLIGPAVVLGLLALVLAARMDPKKLVVIGLIAVLMSRTVEIATRWAPTTYIDEIVILYVTVVLVGRRLLRRRSLRRPAGIWLFVLFAVFGILSSVVSAVPLTVVAAGGILAVKGVLLYFALAQVDWTTDDIPWLARTAAWVLAISLLCALVNLVLPAQWTAVFANTGHPQYRSFLPSLIGPFTHPLQFGNFMSLTAIACAAPLLYQARARGLGKGARSLFLGSVLAAVLSFRRTAIVGLAAGLSFLALRRRNAGMLMTVVLILPIAAVVLLPVIQEVATATYDNYIVEGMKNARTRVTVDSFVLAFQHFPFGVGFGRFGSAIAREQYSIEYVRLGYDAVYGLGSPGNQNNHGRFLTDTQWPAIVGEPGLLGAGFFIGGLWRIFATFRRAARVAHLPLALLGLVGMGWTVHILVESVAYPVFVTAPTYPLLFGLGAIVYVILTTASPADVAPKDVSPSAGADVRPVGGPAEAGRPRVARSAPGVTRTRGTEDDSGR